MRKDIRLNTLFVVVALAGSATGNAIEPRINLFVETPLRPIIHGTTNLPDGTTLMLSLLRPESGYLGQAKVRVLSSHFASERFSLVAGLSIPANIR
jgi:hypothetical protein